MFGCLCTACASIYEYKMVFDVGVNFFVEISILGHCYSFEKFPSMSVCIAFIFLFSPSSVDA